MKKRFYLCHDACADKEIKAFKKQKPKEKVMKIPGETNIVKHCKSCLKDIPPFTPAALLIVG